MTIKQFFEVINYKKKKIEFCRQQRDKYGYGWSVLEAAGDHWAARYPLKVAESYSASLVKLETSKESSYSLWKRDQKRKAAFEALYPDSVELWF